MSVSVISICNFETGECTDVKKKKKVMFVSDSCAPVFVGVESRNVLDWKGL